MTNGTLEYLEKIRDNHPTITIHFMQNKTSTTVYYEDTRAPIFKEARGYDIITRIGTLDPNGYVMMKHIPVTDDGKPIFESEFKQRANKIEQVPGFCAFRVLRPLHGNTYVLFVQWNNEESYHAWLNSNAYKETYGEGKKPKYRAGKPFTTTYSMVDWEAIYQEREEEEGESD